MPELSKAFEHAEVDPRWYAFWESIGAFRADPASGKPRFSMVIPPPNVTGSLHMGHALNHTLPDIIARWKRMQGFDVLWLPGTDHAGIATQNVVEKQLRRKGRRVTTWAARPSKRACGSGSRATAPSPARCASWGVGRLERERFTLDDSFRGRSAGCSSRSTTKGLIYRGAYIVNWCPRCRTALSDLEVVHKDTTGKLWYVRYPGADGGEGVTVATTRPETMLGDTAIAVNPDDPRYRARVWREGSPADHRARTADRRRRVRRPGVRDRRRQGDAGARPQRLPDGEAPQPARGRGHRRGREDHGGRRSLRRPRPVQGPRAHRRAAGTGRAAREGRGPPARGRARASAAARWSSRSCRRSGS